MTLQAAVKAANSQAHDSGHLGTEPEPWEEAQGPLGERVKKQGSEVIAYAKKMAAMGVEEQGVAGENNPLADHVQAMGREKMRILKPSSQEMAGPGARTFSSGLKKFMEEESDLESDSDSSMASAVSNSSVVDAAKEAELQEEVEDWDTLDWTLEQVEASLKTLLQECYSTPDRRRMHLASAMILKLMEVHTPAQRWMERRIEAVANDGLPSLVKGVVDPVMFKVCHLLAALAPTMAGHFHRLNVIPRILRLMLFGMDTAARLIISRYRLNAKRAATFSSGLPLDVAVHQRTTLMVQWSALLAKWRGIRERPECGHMPDETLGAFLEMLLALCQQQYTVHCREHRVQLVANHGVLAIARHLRPGDPSRSTAWRIVFELAQEKILLYELLRLAAPSHLIRLLQSHVSTEQALEILDAIDALGFGAMHYSDINGDASGVSDPSELLGGAEDDNSSEVEESVIVPPLSQMVPKIEQELGCEEVVQGLAHLLMESDTELFLGGVIALGKLAYTACYGSVLGEILAFGGRGLESIVVGMLSSEEPVPSACLALFLQLCSRQEGRDGIQATDGVSLVMPMCSGERNYESDSFIRGLTCLVALARTGVYHLIKPPAGRAVATGAAATGAATAAALKEKLYQDLMEALESQGSDAQDCVDNLAAMGSLEQVLHFLVRPEKKRHFFKLPQEQACAGAIILHSLVVLTGAPHPLIFSPEVLNYLSYSIQTSYNDLSEGRIGQASSEPLLFQSVQLSCRALAFMCACQSPDNALRQVADCLISTASLNEVAAMLQLPNFDNSPMYFQLARSVQFAALLAANLCPIPAGERDPFTKFAEPQDEDASQDRVAPLLRRLLNSLAPPLCSSLSYAADVEVIACLCMALSRLSNTDANVAALLEDHNIMEALSGLRPKAPAVLPLQQLEEGSLTGYYMAGGLPSDTSTRKLCQLPPEYYTVLANITRIPNGRKAVMVGGALKRCLERMSLDYTGSDGKNYAKNLQCRGEIAVLLARTAGSYDQATGSANDFILNAKYQVVRVLLGMLAGFTRRHNPQQIRYQAALALSLLIRDSVKTIPQISAAGGVAILCEVLADPSTPGPILSLVVVIVGHLAAVAACRQEMSERRALVSLGRIANQFAMSADDAQENSALRSVRTKLAAAARECAYKITEAPKASPRRVEDASQDASPAPEVGAQPGTLMACGTTACGSLCEGMPTSAQRTPIALLSAREAGFRKELQRRKEAYGMTDGMPRTLATRSSKGLLLRPVIVPRKHPECSPPKTKRLMGEPVVLSVVAQDLKGLSTTRPRTERRGEEAKGRPDLSMQQQFVSFARPKGSFLNNQR